MRCLKYLAKAIFVIAILVPKSSFCLTIKERITRLSATVGYSSSWIQNAIGISPEMLVWMRLIICCPRGRWTCGNIGLISEWVIQQVLFACNDPVNEWTTLSSPWPLSEAGMKCEAWEEWGRCLGKPERISRADVEDHWSWCFMCRMQSVSKLACWVEQPF